MAHLDPVLDPTGRVQAVTQATGRKPSARSPNITMSGKPMSFENAQMVATIAAPVMHNIISVTPDAATKHPNGLKA